MSESTDDLSKLLSSATLVFAGTVIGSSSMLLERILVGRLLSPDAYGEFSIAIAIFTLGSTLGAAGFTQGVPRFMARFEDRRDIRGAWLTGLLFSLTFSIVIASILLLASPVIVPYLFESPESTLLFQLFVITIPLYVCFKIGVGAIRGEENTQFKVLTQNISYPLIRLLLIAALLWLGVGVIGTGIGYLVTLVAVISLTYILLNRLFPLRGGFSLHSRDMTMFSMPLVVSTIMTTLFTKTDTLMIGYFRASNEVGIYNAAYPLAGVISVVLGTFGYLYLPVASRLDNDEEGSVERVYEITTKWVFLLVLPLLTVLLAFPNEIITIMFGTDYSSGGAALSVLALGFFTNAAVGRNRETLSALGATVFILIANSITFAFNFMLNLVLIPPYGFIGAAVASASAYFVLNILIYLFLRFQFDITPFSNRSLRLYIVLPLILIPLSLFIGYWVSGSLPIIILFGLVMGVLTVFLVIAIGGLESEDIVLIEFIEDAAGTQIPYIRRYIPGE